MLNALDTFCDPSNRNAKAKLDELHSAWASYPVRRMRIMQSSTAEDSSTPEVDAWDNEIAKKFMYGDLVHGDDNAELLDALGDEQVIYSAAAMVSDGFKLVNNTFQVMHWLRPDIAPENAYFTQKLLDQQSRSQAPQ